MGEVSFQSILLEYSIEMSFRLLGFGGCLIGAAVCFVVAFFTLPFLAIRCVVFTSYPASDGQLFVFRPAKFALAFRYDLFPPACKMTLIASSVWGAYLWCLGKSLMMVNLYSRLHYYALQIFGLNWANKPPEASNFEGATTFLCDIFRELRAYPIFLTWSMLFFRILCYCLS